jgi:polyisoprenoid-binding protein YceI
MLAQGRSGAPARFLAETATLLVACATCIGCAPRRPAPLPPKPIDEITLARPAPSSAPVISGTARVFQVDAERSVVTVEVRRAGPLGRLGHNHVVTSRRLAGRAWVGATPAESGFVIRLPVASLVVDDPTVRAAAGPDFEGEVSDSARQGTYANMTRPEVLDLAQYPDVEVHAPTLEGTWDQPRAQAQVTIRGVTRTVAIPLQLRRDDATVTASGHFAVLQSDFGITPFSIAAGAIQVADEVRVAFSIVAVRP